MAQEATTAYTSSAGSFTYSIPAWAQYLDIVAIGGGGGSQGSGFYSTNGALAGTWNGVTVDVTSLGGATTLAVTVGAGGAGGPAGGDGGAGGASSVSTLLTAAGAPKGSNSNNTGVREGQAAGNYTFNGVTYIGGDTATANNVGNPPGGGGAGRGSFNVTGRAGGIGGVWIRAWATGINLDTSPLAVTATLTASLARNATLQATTVVQAASPLGGISGQFVENMSRGQSIDASTSVTANTTPTGRYAGSMNTNLFVNATLLAAGVNTLRAAATLAVVCGFSASATEFGTAAATLALLATIAAAAQRTANLGASTAVSAATTAAGSRGQMVDVDTAVTATVPAGVRYDAAVMANLVVNAVLLGVAARNASVDASTAVTVGRTASLVVGPAIGASTVVTAVLSAAASVGKSLAAELAVGVTFDAGVSAAFDIGAELDVVVTAHAGYGSFREIVLVLAQDRRALVPGVDRTTVVSAADRAVSVLKPDLGVVVPAVPRLALVGASVRSAAVPVYARVVVVDPDVTEARVI